MKKIILLLILASIYLSCKKTKDAIPDIAAVTPTPINNNNTPGNLIFKFKFDSTQVRLNNFGQVSSIPSDHRAQSPKFNTISSHYIEMIESEFTALGAGAVLYHAAEVTTGGSTAIDFSQSIKVGEGEVFLSIPFSQIPAGNYKYLRVSLSYQNYTVIVYSNVSGTNYPLNTTVASFIGFNTYISTFSPGSLKTFAVNGNRKQGYFGYEGSAFSQTFGDTAQAPSGATTVPNPIFATSPIPQGSCLVTGQFANTFVVTGTETSDRTITISLSTNKSFEWKEGNGNSLYEPAAGDTVTDMGIRGLIPIVQ